MLLAAALCLAALAPARARAQPHSQASTKTSTKTRKPASQPVSLNSDQLSVVAASINDTFPRPRHEPLTLALCLDVQIATVIDEDAPPPPPPPRRRGARKRAPEPEVPPQPIVRGAPPELVAGLARPWRVVASALSCRLDPSRPIALADERHTPAQLVTVHLAPDVAVGPLKIDWTDGHDPTAANSRDCTAARGPRGWSVRCGGTWFQ
jgi:hypothetical protein